MSDEAMVREMRDILEQPEPIDGVELRDGYGADYWIVSAHPVVTGDGERELEILVDASRADGSVIRIPVQVSLDDLEHIDADADDGEWFAEDPANG